MNAFIHFLILEIQTNKKNIEKSELRTNQFEEVIRIRYKSQFFEFQYLPLG